MSRRDASGQDDPLEAALVALGIAPDAIARARSAATRTGAPWERVMVQLGLLPETRLAEAYGRVSGLPVATSMPPRGAVDVAPVTAEFLRINTILPLSRDESTLLVAVPDPDRAEALETLGQALGLDVVAGLAPRSDIEAALSRFYTSAKGNAATGPGEDDMVRLRDLASEEPIIRLANEIVEQAMGMGASDIHLEPRADGMHLRLRVDGILRPLRIVPPSDAPALVSRLKIMARLDISERRLPQDGRIRITARGREADLRVSTVPSLGGEAVVMRILDRDATPQSLAALGFGEDVRETFEAMLRKPNGIVLVTGPVGSGKTTTLYAALRLISTPERKLLTVEDPVEYRLDDAVQVQTKSEIGLDFATALRAFLRHDPDIVMLGEIRDSETAGIAVQTALTGRLVLSTLHANSSLAAVARLADIGIEPYLIASVVNGVVAQRLVRRLCEACREPLDLPADSDIAQRLAGGRPMRAVGCDACSGTGYRGRFAIVEAVPFTEALQSAVLRQATVPEMERIAREAGLDTLETAGLRAVAEGRTTIEEVARAAGDL